ncbi:Crp/Fnr family transcriptional regulator [Chitinophaga nivalis]|uniref:Crp/Fnr family transcriptional regulator n=1 Tax=Chitinophaga nivalis TaxID=2991709 RepID=A0ABT3IPM2_9BACT|nr:Crp/Fnr family transcriptional regulator [Chitinophaga nivalis]MCW3464384.1 Crp/Fnr family transcriptional regulator [Chitinophaga nivalis]MCW3485925.1 Crp/Fnr family transcriptional regulator [Chitinophaga nivalis]
MDQEEEIKQLVLDAFQDEALYDAYVKVAEEKVFKKGELLIEQGRVCRFCYFIIKGAVRSYYAKDDKEITTSFCFEEDPVFSLESVTRQTPCPESFEALEDTVIEAVSFNDLLVLRQQFPAIERLWLLGVEAYAIWLEERLHSLQFNTAKERYQSLLQKYPYMIQRVQLRYIASYLGITLETLSRIRAQL